MKIEDENSHIAPLLVGDIAKGQARMVNLRIHLATRCMTGNSLDGFCILVAGHEGDCRLAPLEAEYQGPPRWAVDCAACGQNVQHTGQGGFEDLGEAQSFATQHRINHVNALVEEMIASV